VTREDREAVVVSSIVTDGGWTARDENGNSLAVAVGNGPFLAIRIPSGDHRVTLSYTPPGFRPGNAISSAALLALAASFFALERRSRVRQEPA